MKRSPTSVRLEPDEHAHVAAAARQRRTTIAAVLRDYVRADIADRTPRDPSDAVADRDEVLELLTQ